MSLYKNNRNKIKALDLICFKGGDPVSALIRGLEKAYDGDDRFSHVGVIVTTEVLSHPKMKPGSLYILESTATGFLGCGVKNIEGKALFGVQITDFDKLVKHYNGEIAVCSLDVPVFENVKPRLQAFWEQWRGVSYEFNMFTMLAAIFPFLRRWRTQVEKVVGGENWVFCSQLACMLYQAIGVFPETIQSKDVVPEDFLGNDSDHQVPLMVLPPLYLKTKTK